MRGPCVAQSMRSLAPPGARAYRIKNRGAVLGARRMDGASLKHARGAAGIDSTWYIALNCGAPYCTSISVTFRISGRSA